MARTLSKSDCRQDRGSLYVWRLNATACDSGIRLSVCRSTLNHLMHRRGVRGVRIMWEKHRRHGSQLPVESLARSRCMNTAEYAIDLPAQLIRESRHVFTCPLHVVAN